MMLVPACFQEHLQQEKGQGGDSKSFQNWILWQHNWMLHLNISHLRSGLHPWHLFFFLFGHSSKSKHLFSGGRIGISILHSLSVETLLIDSPCLNNVPACLNRFHLPQSSPRNLGLSQHQSSRQTGLKVAMNCTIRIHSESLRVSELVNPNPKNEPAVRSKPNHQAWKNARGVYNQIQDIQVHLKSP